MTSKEGTARTHRIGEFISSKFMPPNMQLSTSRQSLTTPYMNSSSAARDRSRATDRGRAADLEAIQELERRERDEMVQRVRASSSRSRENSVTRKRSSSLPKSKDKYRQLLQKDGKKTNENEDGHTWRSGRELIRHSSAKHAISEKDDIKNSSSKSQEKKSRKEPQSVHTLKNSKEDDIRRYQSKMEKKERREKNGGSTSTMTSDDADKLRRRNTAEAMLSSYEEAPTKSSRKSAKKSSENTSSQPSQPLKQAETQPRHIVCTTRPDSQRTNKSTESAETRKQANMSVRIESIAIEDGKSRKSGKIERSSSTGAIKANGRSRPSGEMMEREAKRKSRNELMTPEEKEQHRGRKLKRRAASTGDVRKGAGASTTGPSERDGSKSLSSGQEKGLRRRASTGELVPEGRKRQTQSMHPHYASSPPVSSKSIGDTDQTNALQSAFRRHASTGTIKKTSKSNGGDDEFVFIPRQKSNVDSQARRSSMRASVKRIDFLRDDPMDMTYGRRIALSLIGKKWYNPAAGEDGSLPRPPSVRFDETVSGGGQSFDEEVTKAAPLVTQIQHPSLARAWAYFEHDTLPRYIVGPKVNALKKNIFVRMIRKMFCKGSKTLDRAEPGENVLPTKLYSPIFTPLSQMGDFGIGFGLYFSSLRALTVLTLLAGLMNIPSLLYFSGPDYSQSQPGVHPLLKGSAICTNQIWVPCADCTSADFENNPDRLAKSNTTDQNGKGLVFALRNDCDGATLQQGMVNYGTLLLILLGIVAMNRYQKWMEVKYDEDEQTAQDYSVIISNPPPDATDPEEWRLFFRNNFDGAHTTVVTIAVDNDFLVHSLLERRECMRRIELLLDPGTPLNDLNLARISAQIERERSLFDKLLTIVSPGIPELLGRVTSLTTRIQGLAQQDYPAKNVFVTFETEAAQRLVLSKLSVGSIAANHNRINVMAKTPQYLFRKQYLLRVLEPEEPSTVRWQDLNAKWLQRSKQVLTTTLATLGMIVCIALLIRLLHDSEPIYSALVIAVANGIFPEFAKLLTKAEAHSSEGGKQTSLYFKIAVFRWVNTAIVITIITPFTSTLDNNDGLINSIGAIFFADIVTTNVIQLLDPVGHLKRHLLAPRAKTQDHMNLIMQGQEIELAERYTNMTKMFFLTLWYCSIYPGIFFMCSFALLVNFFVDRFSLMRTWKRAPALGTTISKFSRRYFFSMAIVAMAVVSSYDWAGFPFDNLCDSGEPVNPIYDGTHTITTLGSHSTTNVTVNIFSTGFNYCLQEMLLRRFPALPDNSEWMTKDQVTVTTIYAWTSVGVIALVALSFVWGWYESFRGLFRSTYEPNGEDQHTNFSDVPSIGSYVPQVTSTVFSYPLFACNIDGIDEALFDWTDPDRPHSYYDLTKDAEEMLHGLDISGKHVFSTMRHWHPKEQGSDDYRTAESV